MLTLHLQVTIQIMYSMSHRGLHGAILITPMLIEFFYEHPWAKFVLLTIVW